MLEQISKIFNIATKDINVSDDNVRLSDPEKNIAELAASIKKHGLLQPVVLLGDENSPKPYKLITGQRRLLAHEFLGCKTIKAVFVGSLDKTNIILRSLVENMQRLDLDYTDTSRAITALYHRLNKDDRKVASETGLSLKKVREYIAIEALASPKIKKQLREHKITPMDVKRALRAAHNSIAKAERLIDLIIEVKPTSDQKRRIADYGLKLVNSSAETILEEAMKPHIQKSIVLTLSESGREGLTLATKKLKMDPEELASKIMEEWLLAEGFTKK